MKLTLYDTKTRASRAILKPSKDFFKIYCCGPTVYGPAHIGNFRTYVINDTILRLLKLLGFKTRFVRNITDVDDKIIRKSQEQNKSLKAFTNYWTQFFENDCQRLHLLKPDVEPKATETIEDQQALIKILLAKGHAYVADGSVYFRIQSFKNYGQLSQLDIQACQTQKENSAGAVNDVDEYVRDSVGDFALWKKRKPEDGDIFWESPWGQGRPGWHIECSAMSHRYLGEPIDLHVGGIDLCFPHHENEVAQSEAAYGAPCVQHWMHIAHLQIEGQKMSKSLGNLYTLDMLLEKAYSPESIRYALLAGHYRQPLNFTFDFLKAAQSALEKLYPYVHRLLEQAGCSIEKFEEEYIGQPLTKCDCLNGFFEAFCDDLNVPKALGQLFTFIHQHPKISDEELEATLKSLGAAFFLLGLPAQASWNKQKEIPIPLPVRHMADQRWQAKQAKKYAEADEIRKILFAEGWQILDATNSYQIIPVKSKPI